MGTLHQFPKGEPPGEEPKIGYCTLCGAEVSYPNDASAWPESCPQGCTPFSVQSWKPGITFWETGGPRR